MTSAIPKIRRMIGGGLLVLWLGATEDAITVGKTVTKSVLGYQIRLIDERQTLSIVSAIFPIGRRGRGKDSDPLTKQCP